MKYKLPSFRNQHVDYGGDGLFHPRKFTYQNLILDIFQNSGYNLVSVPVCYSHLHVYCMLRRVNTSLFMNSKSLLLCVVSDASSVK